MKLHQVHDRADWELMPPDRRNPLQTLAARTNSIITPGNMLSLVGLILVFIGLGVLVDNRIWAGFITIGIGRACDIADGFVADRTGTKSPIGEGVDAAFDKIAAIASIVVFIAKHVVPWPLALIIGVENLLTSSLSLVAKQQRKRIHPAASGKIGGAIEWVAFATFILAAAIHGHGAHMAKDYAYILAVVAIALNSWATLQYAQLLLERRNP